MLKKINIFVVCILLVGIAAHAQVEQGDKEINFSGSLVSLVGMENYSSTSINLMFSYGYFVSDNLQIGIGPAFTYTRSTFTFSSWDPATFSIVEEESVSEDTQVSGYVFFNLNFATASKTVPYIAGQWYQYDFSPESGKFMDASYVNVGFGIRNFFSKYAALNTSANYGFALSEDTEGGVLLITTGISIIL